MNDLQQQNSLYSLLKKKSVIAIIVAIIACVYAVTYYFSSIEYENKKAELTQETDVILTTWVKATNQSLYIWTQSIEERSLRISAAELISYFMYDVNEAGKNVESVINELDTTTRNENSTAISSFIEQVPLMRNVLFDYMNYNGLIDVRLVSPTGTTILSAVQRPAPITETQKAIVAKAIESKAAAYAPLRSNNSGLILDYAMPVIPEGFTDNNTVVGAVLFSMPVTTNISQFLGREVRQKGIYSPIIVQLDSANGMQVLTLENLNPQNIKNINFDEAGNLVFAKRPSIINSQNEVYSYGSKVANMNMWTYLEQPAEQLDSEFRYLAWISYGIGFLGSTGALLLLALLCWIYISTQEKANADRFRELYRVIASQNNMLDNINNSITSGILVIDQDSNIMNYNKAFSKIIYSEENIMHKNLTNIFDWEVAKSITYNMHQISEKKLPSSFEITMQNNSEIVLYRVNIYPYIEDGEIINGAVAIFQDITEFRKNSEKSKQQQKNMINALVHAIETVDPYLVGHSKMMAQLGELIAKQMGMTDEEKIIIEDASTFSQIGKLFVPREILSKTGKLSDEEQALIKQIPDKGYDVLSNIGINEKIAQTVRQIYEQVDGNGYPQHLKGDEILVYARILSITNTLIAMLSDRSYRSGLSLVDVITRMQKDKHIFDEELMKVVELVVVSPEGSELLSKIKDKGLL